MEYMERHFRKIGSTSAKWWQKTPRSDHFCYLGIHSL